MTPADYVRWYSGAAERMSAPSLDPVKAAGLVYAKLCGAKLKRPKLSRRAIAHGLGKKVPKVCPARHRNWSHAERQWVCGRCGAPWRFWVRQSLRGEVQETGTRQEASEKRLQRLVDVGLAIRRLLADPRWGWEGKLYALWARGESERDIAVLGLAGKLGEAPFTWNRDSVRRRIQAGGREWRRILTAAGFPFEDPPGGSAGAD